MKGPLERLTKICLALPEAEQRAYGSHVQFVVRKKTFAYFLDNHHGDGKVAVCAKALPGDNAALAKRHPDRFFLPAYLAARTWVSLRLDRPGIDWDEVKDLIRYSYEKSAPKTLVAQLPLE